MVIRIGVMSDLHIEHDVTLARRAMAHAVQGITGGVAVNWWRHLNAREADPGHPLYGPDLMAVRGVDLLLLAGDIWHGVDGIAYADAAAAYCGCPAVMVSGKHDLYGSDMAVILPRMVAARRPAGASASSIMLAPIFYSVGGGSRCSAAPFGPITA